MSELNNNKQVKYIFVIGIFLSGLLIGAVSMYFFNPKEMESRVEYVEKEIENSEDTKSDEKKNSSGKSKSSGSTSESTIDEEVAGSDTLQQDNPEPDTLSTEINDDLTDILLDDEENIKVKREKFLKSIYYTPFILDNPEESSAADSLLGNKLGIDNRKAEKIAVEFWESPLSAKGYIYEGKKIKLYGISPQLTLIFYIKDNNLYLETEYSFYWLKPSSEFQKFIVAKKENIKK